MVHDFAMGTAGVGRSPEGDVRLSETTLRIRDEERQDLIEEARRAAQRMILAHRHQLDALANELLEHEVLERDSIERIMEGVPRLERAPGVGLRVVAAAEAHGAPPGPEAIDISKPPAGPSPLDAHDPPWEGGAGRL
jgi:cell division protease FtsH